jgi:hypothetical protein
MREVWNQLSWMLGCSLGRLGLVETLSCAGQLSFDVAGLRMYSNALPVCKACQPTA